MFRSFSMTEIFLPDITVFSWRKNGYMWFIRLIFGSPRFMLYPNHICSENHFEAPEVRGISTSHHVFPQLLSRAQLVSPTLAIFRCTSTADAAPPVSEGAPIKKFRRDAARVALGRRDARGVPMRGRERGWIEQPYVSTPRQPQRPSRLTERPDVVYQGGIDLDTTGQLMPSSAPTSTRDPSRCSRGPLSRAALLPGSSCPRESSEPRRNKAGILGESGTANSAPCRRTGPFSWELDLLPWRKSRLFSCVSCSSRFSFPLEHSDCRPSVVALAQSSTLKESYQLR